MRDGDLPVKPREKVHRSRTPLSSLLYGSPLPSTQATGSGRHFLQFTDRRICALAGLYGVIFVFSACEQGHFQGSDEIISCVCGFWGPGVYTVMVSQCRVLHFSIKTAFILFILNPSYWHLLEDAGDILSWREVGWGRGEVSLLHHTDT